MILADISLPYGNLIIILIKITGAIYSRENEYAQTYFFFNVSSSNSYQLTEMSANLRNRTFSEISDPGAECFAPFSQNFSKKEIFESRTTDLFYFI